MQQAHEQLLDLAHALEAAANAGDEEAVERISVVALRELAIHLDDERLMGIKLDAAEPDLAARLEQRRRLIVERLIALSDEPGLADDTCRCAALADEVIALLGDEVAAEEAAIDTYHLPATGPRRARPPSTTSSPTTGSP
jgi:hypothetical protein